MTRQIDDSEHTLRERIAADPRDASAFHELAQLVGSMRGRKDEAVELWRRYIDLADAARLPGARLALGRAQIEARQDGEAVETLRTCVAENPGNIEALCLLGELLRRGGELEEAAKAFRSAAEREPETIRARIALLSCLEAMGNEAEAQSVLQSIQQQAVGDSAVAALLRELMQRRER
jgi:cytochrome c-type biogenesis protein CcmH/NrfG